VVGLELKDFVELMANKRWLLASRVAVFVAIALG